MEILNDFGIQPTLLIGQIVNFTIILFLLKKFFLKPILKVLDDRKQKIEESLKNADLIEQRLEKTNIENKKIINDAQNQAQVLITDAKKEATSISDRAAVEARKTTTETIKQANVQIEALRVEMKKKVEKETMDLVIAVVRKVLGRNLKTSEKQSLTQTASKEIIRSVK